MKIIAAILAALATVVIQIGIWLGLIALAVWVVVQVLQSTGVLS